LPPPYVGANDPSSVTGSLQAGETRYHRAKFGWLPFYDPCVVKLATPHNAKIDEGGQI